MKSKTQFTWSYIKTDFKYKFRFRFIETLKKHSKARAYLHKWHPNQFERRKLMELKFEWDEEKDRINRQKHGISFETASYVFRDEYYIEMYDFEHSMEEDRYIAIGMVGDLLFVVFTERGENIRLISARLATESERRLYYDQNFYN
mgnify:CR=1 FL=1